ncbi:MAG TPA: LPS assembly lipoprotein LptE [Xanthobacteraceae bacterium]|nr:LPS assembly lipoprotein LptE [Xanthobacteraceae bacterium]
MSWLDRVPFRLTAVALLAAAVGGCFQPLYGDRSLTGGSSVRDAMRDVEVAAVDGRVAQEVRNDLIFELTGGEGNPVGAPYRITMTVSTGTFYPVIDLTVGRPSAETVSLDVTYRVEDVANKKIVLTEKALARVTVDRSQQRFARVRAIRDAENRAAKVAAEQIRSRIAAFFLTRT